MTQKMFGKAIVSCSAAELKDVLETMSAGATSMGLQKAVNGCYGSEMKSCMSEGKCSQAYVDWWDMFSYVNIDVPEGERSAGIVQPPEAGSNPDSTAQSV